jgi:hypothetical protein
VQHFVSLMRLMVNNWKNRDPEEWAELTPIFQAIYDEVGAKRFETCTQNCIRYHRSSDGRSFAPSVSEWEVWMPKAPRSLDKSSVDQMAELRRRAEAGEEFYGMADVAEMIQKALKAQGKL